MYSIAFTGAQVGQGQVGQYRLYFQIESLFILLCSVFLLKCRSRNLVDSRGRRGLSNQLRSQ